VSYFLFDVHAFAMLCRLVWLVEMLRMSHMPSWQNERAIAGRGRGTQKSTGPIVKSVFFVLETRKPNICRFDKLVHVPATICNAQL
jgi:hypothetical protein